MSNIKYLEQMGNQNIWSMGIIHVWHVRLVLIELGHLLDITRLRYHLLRNPYQSTMKFESLLNRDTNPETTHIFSISGRFIENEMLHQCHRIDFQTPPHFDGKGQKTNKKRKLEKDSRLIYLSGYLESDIYIGKYMFHIPNFLAPSIPK